MGKKHKPLAIGRVFGKLTVQSGPDTERSPYAGKFLHWYTCLCECGTVKRVRSDKLTSGFTISCGCLTGQFEKGNKIPVTHGMSKTRLFRIWRNMKSRCYNSRSTRYEDYGGRGIGICPEWRERFEVFAEWSLANGYAHDLQIDRRENNGNYEPGNCRWVTRTVNMNNTRRTKQNLT